MGNIIVIFIISFIYMFIYDDSYLDAFEKILISAFLSFILGIVFNLLVCIFIPESESCLIEKDSKTIYPFESFLTENENEKEDIYLKLRATKSFYYIYYYTEDQFEKNISFRRDDYNKKVTIVNDNNLCYIKKYKRELSNKFLKMLVYPFYTETYYKISIPSKDSIDFEMDERMFNSYLIN